MTTAPGAYTALLDSREVAALPDLIIHTLSAGTNVPEEHRELLGKSTIQLTRLEKRSYRRSLEPRLEHYRQVLLGCFADLCRRDPSTPDTWATSIAFNIMSRGYATVADTLGLSVIGRRRVSEIIKAVRPARTSRGTGPA